MDKKIESFLCSNFSLSKHMKINKLLHCALEKINQANRYEWSDLVDAEAAISLVFSVKTKTKLPLLSIPCQVTSVGSSRLIYLRYDFLSSGNKYYLLITFANVYDHLFDTVVIQEGYFWRI